MAASRIEDNIARTSSKAFVEGGYAVFYGGAKGDILIRISKVEVPRLPNRGRTWLTGMQVNTKSFTAIEWSVPADEAEFVTKEEGKRIESKF